MRIIVEASSAWFAPCVSAINLAETGTAANAARM
jgi:hypothetical protein